VEVAQTPDDVAREMLAGQMESMIQMAEKHLTGSTADKIVEQMREVLNLLQASPTAAQQDEPQPIPEPEWMKQIITREGKKLIADGQPNPPGVVGVGNVVLPQDGEETS
jgi:hypothetical protein